MSAPRMVALAALALVACGGTPKRVRKPGQDYLARIKIEGSRAIPEDDLVQGLALHRNQAAGRSLDEYQLTLDTQRIVGAYQKRGFFSVQVTPRIVHKVDAQKIDAQTLIFTVVEGPRATAKVEIIGLPPEIDPAKARALVPLKDGAPLDYVVFDDAKAPLLALVENAGYAHAEMESGILADKAANTATLHYAFDPGPRVTFGTIEVVGVTGPLADAARSRLKFKPGDGYSTKALEDSQEAIYAIGLFASVRVDANREDDAAVVVPVKISIAESTHSELRAGFGAGFDSLTYNGRLRFSASHWGWPSPLTTLGAEFRPELTVLRDNCALLDLLQLGCRDIQPRVRLIGSAAQQDFLRPNFRGEVEGGLDYIAIEAYSEEGARTKLALKLPVFTQRVLAQLGWQFAYYRFLNLSPALDAATQAEIGVTNGGHEQLGALSEVIQVDLRDNPVEPHLGAYAAVSVAEGGRYALGKYDYVQLAPELRGYVPIGETVLAAHARIGAFFGDVPPTERYYAGGASSQRGFADRRLSPEATAVDMNGASHTVVIGGAGLVETGIELRRHVEPWGIKAGYVVFLDGGDVTRTANDINLGNLHWAIGAGIRLYYLPIGAMRFEVARRLNRTDGPDDPSRGEHWNYIFSVGEAF